MLLAVASRARVIGNGARVALAGKATALTSPTVLAVRSPGLKEATRMTLKQRVDVNKFLGAVAAMAYTLLTRFPITI